MEPRIKVLHVTPSFYPAWAYGGPTETVYQLCRALSEIGCEVRVLTTNANGPDRVLDVDTGREVILDGDIAVRYCKRLRRDSVSPALLAHLPSCVRWADVVHLTAVYSFPTIPTMAACRLLGKPLTWSPRGSLQRWPGVRRPFLKATWEAVCRVITPQTTTLHVTAASEQRQSTERFPTLASVVVANGVLVPVSVSRSPRIDGLRIGYLGRLDPKKGIENLLEACAILREQRFTYSLAIAGMGPAPYVASLNNLVRRLSLESLVTMVGEVRDESKRKFFEDIDILVVPSFVENFGMVVAEALAHGVPVVASTGTPWESVETVGCGLWVENRPSSLAAAIAKIAQMPLEEMGRRGRRWMQEEFSWSAIADQMRGHYVELVSRGKGLPLSGRDD